MNYYSPPGACSICNAVHRFARRRWVNACCAARQHARGDLELAKALFRLRLHNEANPNPPYHVDLYFRVLRTVWAKRPAVRRRARMSLRRVFHRRKREARPGWRRMAA